MDIKNKVLLIKHRDDYLKKLKDAWGIGANMSDQARRLVDGDINIDIDRGAIQAMAIVINTQLALDKIELEELEIL